MVKISVSILVLSIFSGVPIACISSDVLTTCYSEDQSKKKAADEAMKTWNEETNAMGSATETKIKVKLLQSSKRNLLKAASIGHPEALEKYCQLALEYRAPARTRAIGIEWCKFGIESVPELKEKLPQSLIEATEKVKYTEVTATKCTLSAQSLNSQTKQVRNLYPLEVGKYWKYSVSGSKPYEVENHISRSKEINGKHWFQLIEYGERFWISNSSEGQIEAVNLYETEAEDYRNLDISVIFKFPVNHGDTWNSGGTPVKYIGEKLINVPAGEFRCHMYHMDLGGINYSDTCIAVDIGVIYNETILNEQDRQVSKLIEYGIRN